VKAEPEQRPGKKPASITNDSRSDDNEYATAQGFRALTITEKEVIASFCLFIIILFFVFFLRNKYM